MLMRDREEFPPCDALPWDLPFSESAEGGPPVPLRVKTNAQQRDGGQFNPRAWSIQMH